jgi:hypothetical protein
MNMTEFPWKTSPARRNAARRFLKSLAVFSLAIFGPLASASYGSDGSRTVQPPRTVRVDSVQVEKVSMVRHDSLFFTIHCFCKGLPQNFWYYFDSLQNAVIVEFFEASVDEFETGFPPDVPFKRLRAATAESKMALTGAEARFVVALDRSKAGAALWSNSVDILGGKGFRVTIGTKFSGYRSMQKGRNHNR